MRFIPLTEVVTENEQVGEDDGINNVTRRVYVNADAVRSFSGRRANTTGQVPSGTRLAFANSAGMIVSESIDEVLAALQPSLQ